MKTVVTFLILLSFIFPKISFSQDSATSLIKNWTILKTQLQRRATIAATLATTLNGSKTINNQKIEKLKITATNILKYLDTLKQFDSLTVAVTMIKTSSPSESLSEVNTLIEKDTKVMKRKDVNTLIVQLVAAENRVAVARYEYNESCKTFKRPDLLFNSNEYTKAVKIEF